MNKNNCSTCGIKFRDSNDFIDTNEFGRICSGCAELIKECDNCGTLQPETKLYYFKYKRKVYKICQYCRENRLHSFKKRLKESGV